MSSADSSGPRIRRLQWANHNNHGQHIEPLEVLHETAHIVIPNLEPFHQGNHLQHLLAQKLQPGQTHCQH